MSVGVEFALRASRKCDVLKRSVSAACTAEADTIELCRNMKEEGLSPYGRHITTASLSMMDESKLFVMARPTAGSFCHSPEEVRLIDKQIHRVRSAYGVVFGVLRQKGKGFELPYKLLENLCAAAWSRSLKPSFHRAFDQLDDPRGALEQLIDLRFRRVLTNGTLWGSGQSVLDGADAIADYLRIADGKIQVVVGGGVRQDNVIELLKRLPLDLPLVDGQPALLVHCYSAVLRNGVFDLDLARQFVDTVKGFSH